LTVRILRITNTINRMKNSTPSLARTTVSLPKDVLANGKRRQKKLRRRSFSNYVEILIADDISPASRNGKREAVAA
jgi:hypothetical protein